MRNWGQRIGAKEAGLKMKAEIERLYQYWVSEAGKSQIADEDVIKELKEIGRAHV